LLLNKILRFAAVITVIITFISCGDRNDTDPIDYNDPEYTLRRAKEVLGEDVKFAYAGYFSRDSILSVAAGVEVADDNTWGIKFYLLETDNGDLNKAFESDLYDGSFNEALIQKIKFPDFDYELIYYNSQDYFMGSGGGEVFSYILDFDQERVYYAHLITETDREISLYISDNTEKIPVIKNFFIGNFKRDYPSFTLLSEDKKLDF
jgi:hypothetical protein